MKTIAKILVLYAGLQNIDWIFDYLVAVTQISSLTIQLFVIAVVNCNEIDEAT